MKTSPKSNIRKKELTQKAVVNNLSFDYIRIINELPCKTVFAIYLSLSLIIAIVALFGFFTFEKMFFFSDIGSDTINTYFPALVQNDNLASESFVFKWSFYTGMGQSVYQGIGFDPLGLINSVLIQIFRLNYTVYGVFYYHFFFYILLSGILFFFYLKRIGIQSVVSIIGALLMTFIGYGILGSSWGYDRDVFIGVIVLFAFEEFFVKKRWYFLPIAFYYLSLNPFHLYIYGVFLFFYILFRLFTSSEFTFKKFFQTYLAVFVFALFGMVINATSITAIYPVIFDSPRVTGEAGLSDVLVSSTSTFDQFLHNVTAILRLFSNDILGTGDNYNGWYNYLEAPIFYCGLISLLLFFQVFAFISNKRKIVYGLFIGLWFLTIAFPSVRYALYLYMGDYYKNGLNFFVSFTIMLFSLQALDFIIRNEKINKLLLIFSLVLLLILLFFPYFKSGGVIISSKIQKFSALFLIIYTFILLMLIHKQWKNFALVSFFVLLSVELVYNVYHTYNKREAYLVKDFKKSMGGFNDGTIDAVKWLKSNDITFFRIEKDYSSGTAIHSSLNDPQAQGYYGTACYSSFNHGNYIRFLKAVDVIPKNEIALWYKLKSYSLDEQINIAFNQKLINKVEADEIKNGKLAVKQLVLKKAMNLKILTEDQFMNANLEKFDDNIFKELVRSEAQTIEIASRWANGLKNRPLLQTMANVKYHLSKNANSTIKQFGYDSVAMVNGIYIYKNRYWLPFGYLKDSAITESEFMKLSSFQKDAMLLRAFVVDSSALSSLSESIPLLKSSDTISYFDFNVYASYRNNILKDSVSTKMISNDYIQINIRNKKYGVMQFSFPFDKGWKVTVDGKNTNLLMINIGLCGIELPEGNHLIELKYEPKFYKVSIIVAIFAWIIYLVCIVLTIRKKRNSSQTKIIDD